MIFIYSAMKTFYGSRFDILDTDYATIEMFQHNKIIYFRRKYNIKLLNSYKYIKCLQDKE